MRNAVPLALLSGALLPLGLAPFDWAPLCVLAFTGMLAALWGQSPRAALLIGWCVGLGRYGVGASWVYVSIHEHGGASVLLAGLMVALFVAFLALLPALAACAWSALRPNTPGRAVAALVATHVLLEFPDLVSRLSWLFAGYSQLATPLAGCWSSASRSVRDHRRDRSAALVGIAGGAHGGGRRDGDRAALAVGAARTRRWTRAQGDPPEVALSGGAAGREMASRYRGAHHRALRRSVRAALGRGDLVLGRRQRSRSMPAAAVLLMRSARGRRPLTRRLCWACPTTIARGTARADPAQHGRCPGGRRGRYVKRALSPASTYRSNRCSGGAIEFFDLPMSRARPGPADQALLRIGDGIGLSMAICYEIAYGDLVRALSPMRA